VKDKDKDKVKDKKQTYTLSVTAKVVMTGGTKKDAANMLRLYKQSVIENIYSDMAQDVPEEMNVTIGKPVVRLDPQ